MGTEHTQGSLTKRSGWRGRRSENPFLSLAGMVDTFMVSTLGANAVAAVIISALTVGFADQIIEFCGSRWGYSYHGGRDTTGSSWVA